MRFEDISIVSIPGQVMELLSETGFTKVWHKKLMGGIAGITGGIK